MSTECNSSCRVPTSHLPKTIIKRTQFNTVNKFSLSLIIIIIAYTLIFVFSLPKNFEFSYPAHGYRLWRFFLHYSSKKLKH